MNRLALVGALAGAALALAGCSFDQVQRGVDVVVAAAPTVVAGVQALTALTTAQLDLIAAANRNDPKVQAVVARVRKGAAINSADAQALADAAPAAGLLVDTGALIGRSVPPTAR